MEIIKTNGNGMNRSSISAQNRQTAQFMGNTIAQGIKDGLNQNNQGIYDVGGSLVDNYVNAIPASMNWTASSASATGALNKPQYIFNEDEFNESVTDNGSGAGSIVAAYGDQFGGRNYNMLFGSTVASKGLRIYGFSIISTITATGAAFPTGISNANLTMLTYDGYGNSVPNQLDFNRAIRNTQYQSGILTFKWDAFIPRIAQFKVILMPGATMELSFFTTPLQQIS